MMSENDDNDVWDSLYIMHKETCILKEDKSFCFILKEDKSFSCTSVVYSVAVSQS